MTHYEITHTIGVQHPYFDTTNFRFDLLPTGDTAEILTKHRLLVKAQGNNLWVVIRETDGRQTVPAGLDISFQLSPAFPDQYFVMGDGASVVGACPASLSIHRKGGVWAILTCPAVPEADLPCPITVQLEPVCRFWEFLVFPKNTTENSQARFLVKEARDAIRFAEGEWVDVKGGNRKAWRVQTTDALPLKQMYPFRVGLWEEVDGMERFCRHLTLPSPTSHSVLQRDTVSSYCYC